MSTDTLPRPRADTAPTPTALRCQACRHPLTDAAEPGGAFVNPFGQIHDLLLTPRAPGAAPAGPVSTDFSWFDGYGWQHTFCGACNRHVGWCYLATGDQQPDLFFGLRKDAVEAL